MDIEVTQLLQMVRDGDQSAQESLIQLAYAELRRIAQSHLRAERAGHTLQPTALVNEAYLRVFSNNSPQFSDRAHFLALMSLVMRRILVDHARSRHAARRGGPEPNLVLDEEIDAHAAQPNQIELLELDRALNALAKEKEAMARYVEMRYFGGMTAEEIAEAVGQSVHVVRKDLRFAQFWLRRELAK